MSRVITVHDVEAAAAEGRTLEADASTLVTPLARDRAAVLGVAIEHKAGAAAPSTSAKETKTLVLESKVRSIARRMLLREGRDLADLEEVVAAVMDRLGHQCECGCSR